jgi:hypothetical protein
VPAEQLRSLLGLTSVEYVQGQHSLVVLFISIAIFDFNPKVRNATLFG